MESSRQGALPFDGVTDADIVDAELEKWEDRHGTVKHREGCDVRQHPAAGKALGPIAKGIDEACVPVALITDAADGAGENARVEASADRLRG